MGCENDMGYLAVLAEYDENCDYDIQEVYPTILFADSPSATHWNNITGKLYCYTNQTSSSC